MRNLTSPQAILLGLIAFAIASIPYSSNLVTPAIADSHNQIHKIAICDPDNRRCAGVTIHDRLGIDSYNH